jgi:hypothetical protein
MNLDFAALIDATKVERIPYCAEEKREERGQRFRADQARRAANALMRSTSWLVCECQPALCAV